MIWDYRLLAHQDETGHIEFYAVHEVYYNNGDIISWTAEPVELTDGTPSEIVETFQKVAKDLLASPTLLIQEDTQTLEILPLISKEGDT